MWFGVQTGISFEKKIKKRLRKLKYAMVEYTKLN